MIALLVFIQSLPDPHWIALALAVLLMGVLVGWEFRAATPFIDIRALGSLLMGVLVGWEFRAATPFIDIRALGSNAALTRTYLRNSLSLICLYTILYGLAQWLEASRGVSALGAGLLILPMTVLGSAVSLYVSKRRAVRGPLTLGAAASMVGSFGILLFTSTTSWLLIVVVMLIFGVTLGTSTVTNQLALFLEAPASQLGTARDSLERLVTWARSSRRRWSGSCFTRRSLTTACTSLRS